MYKVPEIKTDEQAYSYVMNKLLEQGQKSVDDAGECQYRGFSEKFIEEAKSRISDEFDENEDSDAFYEELLNVLYNKPSDTKCAAGYLINDAEYDRTLEGQTIQYENSVYEAIQKSNPLWRMNEKSSALVAALQTIHDQKPEHEWHNYLETLGYSFNIHGEFMPLMP